jgi:hypothetical protein
MIDLFGEPAKTPQLDPVPVLPDWYGEYQFANPNHPQDSEYGMAMYLGRAVVGSLSRGEVTLS